MNIEDRRLPAPFGPIRLVIFFVSRRTRICDVPQPPSRVANASSAEDHPHHVLPRRSALCVPPSLLDGQHQHTISRPV